MDAVATMGGLLPAEAWGRDAVHVAVFSAYSTEPLKPGQRVAILNEEGGKDMRVRSDGTHVGIVDPFLSAVVERGERFWVYLYPRTITALSHRWSHPAFEATETTYTPPAQRAAAEARLKDFADSDGVGYGDLISALQAWFDDDCDGIPCYGTDHNYQPVPTTLWDDAEIVLGQHMPPKAARPEYFRCAC